MRNILLFLFIFSCDSDPVCPVDPMGHYRDQFEAQWFFEPDSLHIEFETFTEHYIKLFDDDACRLFCHRAGVEDVRGYVPDDPGSPIGVEIEYVFTKPGYRLVVSGDWEGIFNIK